MDTVGAYEAKTHLSELLVRVEKGESIIITRHGTAIAELRPVGSKDGAAIIAAIKDLERFRSTHTAGAKEIREMIVDGRRY